MRAAVWTAYGGPEVLKIQEVPKPIPKDNEILVKIHATTVTAGDCEMRSLKLPMSLGPLMRLYTGIKKPKRVKILGQELSGVVEAAGNEVTKYAMGDMIFGSTEFSFGTYAEYVCLPESRILIKKPEKITFEQAASIPTGGFTAYHFLKKAKIQKGQKLLLIGAGGSIGTFGIQYIKQFGPEITAVDSGEKFEMLKSIGVDHVIDYKKVDIATIKEKYDIIFDIVGKNSLGECLKLLNKKGKFLMGNPKLSWALFGKWRTLFSSKKIIGGAAEYSEEILNHLLQLVTSGVIKIIIDKTLPLEKIVEAHEYVEQGRKKGNIVITI